MNIRKNWFESNPKKTIFLTVLLLFFLIFLISEIILRVHVNFNPSYYMAKSYIAKRNNFQYDVLSYPYGEIIFNKYGFPDKDFCKIKCKPRIAYIGDSICYGVGAGYGYRISDIIRKEIPENEQMNMSGGLDLGTYGRNILLQYVKEFQIDKVIYLIISVRLSQS